MLGFEKKLVILEAFLPRFSTDRKEGRRSANEVVLSGIRVSCKTHFDNPVFIGVLIDLEPNLNREFREASELRCDIV